MVIEALQWGLPNIELSFSQPITLRIFVGAALNGQTLNVVRSTSGSSGWTASGIVDPATCIVTAGVCSFQATKASYFASTRTVAAAAVTSTTSSSSTSGGGGGGGGGTDSPLVCNDTKPGSAPTIVNAVAGENSVTLTWSKAKDPVSYYLVTYGLSAGSQQYGNPNVGGSSTTSYTISGLSGGVTYYFKVRAGNGCAPGDFSNELSVAPGGGVVSSPAVGFAPGVLGTTSEENVGIGEDLGQVKGEVTESSQPAVTVQPQSKTGGPFNAKVAVVVVVLLLGGFGLFRLLFK